MATHNKSKNDVYRVGWPSISAMAGARLKCIVTGSEIWPIQVGNSANPLTLRSYIPCLYDNTRPDCPIVGPICEHIGDLAEKSPEKITISQEHLEYFRRTNPELAARKWSDIFVEA